MIASLLCNVKAKNGPTQERQLIEGNNLAAIGRIR